MIHRNYRLTKSKYIRGLQCIKAMYLDVYEPDKALYSWDTLTKFKEGRNFEQKIKNKFANGIDVSQLVHSTFEAPELTASLLADSHDVTLFEAGFLYNEVLILADIVHKHNDIVDIYEIKHSTQVSDTIINDAAIQYYVTAHCTELNSFNIIHNNGNEEGQYVDVTSQIKELQTTVENNVTEFLNILQGFEPNVATGSQCLAPYECPYKKYCHRQDM